MKLSCENKQLKMEGKQRKKERKKFISHLLILFQQRVKKIDEMQYNISYFPFSLKKWYN
jgi:hypothetical protein